MLDKTKDRIDRFKTTNKQYSDEGKRQAKEILRSRREDERKNEHHSSADEYADIWKERGKSFKRQSLGKQISILVIIIIALVIIFWGWLG